MRRSALLAGIVTMLLVAACGGRESGPAGDAPPTVEPRATDTRFPDGLVFSIMGQTDTTFRPELQVRGYDLMVIGRVIEELPARWTTSDQLRPNDVYRDLPHPYTIVTPYVLELGLPDELQAMTGPIIPLTDRGATEFSMDATRVVVLLEGGKAGQDVVENATVAVPLTVGARVMVGVHATRAKDSDAPSERVLPTEAGPGWWGIAIAGLNDDGSATVFEQALSATEVVGGILDAVEQMNAAIPIP